MDEIKKQHEKMGKYMLIQNIIKKRSGKKQLATLAE